ncbi:zinc-binding dehydrogenase [Rubrobacter marinus]|uniref:Zinc-binding dehydrogenase n=2 Tax=Rubrobacter marinus TaxID=2653852 RepID=A0A6G8Q286_9ACTN|nr:zinc-binding dehydrogenase [Rubrobacter marinus]
MRAALVREFGGPEVLREEEVPLPAPGEGEVLIELEAAGVNRADALTRSGRYHAAGQPPIVPGFEGSGVVRQTGASVTDVGVGDRVFAFGGRPGFYAEYAAVHEGRVVRMPDGLGWDAAAALPVAPLTAFYCLRRLARVEPGETVLVWAAASGVGDVAVQLAKAAGATVIATAGSDEKLDWALGNGADHGVNHSGESVVDRVLELTGGAGAEVVLDTVGGARFGESLKAAGHGGRVVALANVALEESVIDTRDFYPKNVAIYGFQVTNLMQRLGYDPREDLAELASAVVAGDLKVHVDRTFPLREAAGAHRHLEGRLNRGKVMLHPGERG